jgi:hypothetical protein
MKKWKNRCTAWIACLAILAAAFMPSISSALVLAHESAAFTAPVCSADHAQHQAVAQEQAPEHQAGHTDHCPLCVKQGHALDLPRPAPGFAAQDIMAGPLASASGQDAFYSAVSWIHLPSRAPPAHS